MAIVEMKKIRLLALNRDKPQLLKTLQKLGCVQVEDAEDAPKEADSGLRARIEDMQKRVQRLDLCILRLSPFDKHKQGMLSLRPVADGQQVTQAVSARGDMTKVVERVEEIERVRGELRTRETREKGRIEALTPWEALDFPLERAEGTRCAKVYLLQIPARELNAFCEAASALKYVAIEEIGKAREVSCVVAAAHREVAPQLEALFEAAHASQQSFSEGQGTVALMLENARDALKRIDETRARLDQEIDKLADNLPPLRLLRDIDQMEADRLTASGKFAETKSAFLMTGWAPAKRAEEITRAVKAVASVSEIEFTDPEPEEQSPVQLRNGKAIAPFESIVRMFALPDPNGIDPTFIMTPFWVCFFGMMVSDAGYGLILGLACAYISHKLKRRKGMGQMTFVLALGGLSTVFWGAMYGGWFGEEFFPPLLFAPMDNPIGMLVLCLALGCVHLLTGMGVAAYMNIKRGKPLDALFDQGFWVMLLAGLGLLLVNGTVGGVIAGVGALGILATAGRAKGGNIFKRIIGGFGALYGVTSYLSDILSYARLFGMGLATGVIGMVVNTLALMTWGSWPGYIFTIVILLFGHALNLAINALGAYVHSCRLQYIEFFNKFYETGGKDFKPLSADTRYVDIEA